MLASIYTSVPETDRSLSTDVACFNCLIFQVMDQNMNRRSVNLEKKKN